MENTPPKAIIIGASSGIGKELARIYSENGYEVGITGRRIELLEELAKELPGKTYICKMDITKPDESIKSLEELIEQMVQVDIIVISAGTGNINEELDWQVENETIDTNVSGFTAIADTAMRYFIKRKSGHLVGISSIASLRGGYQAPAYNASKAYASNYLEGLRVKAAKLKLPIYVTDILPGFVDTAMAKGDGLFWIATPEKAARQIYRAIDRKKSRAYITNRWKLIAMLLKLLPDCLYKKL